MLYRMELVSSISYMDFAIYINEKSNFMLAQERENKRAELESIQTAAPQTIGEALERAGLEPTETNQKPYKIRKSEVKFCIICICSVGKGIPFNVSLFPGCNHRFHTDCLNSRKPSFQVRWPIVHCVEPPPWVFLE